jgi:hypothetical protein
MLLSTSAGQAALLHAHSVQGELYLGQQPILAVILLDEKG